ncbi:polysaccharide deacetylase family protein [Aquimarina sp. 2201CG14-23]|uniref:polysaccharide deacetylase family protein n=1 Tax=Aquimarina mycalae TaxID=3040073 RepID=UPI00247824EC|nr:polysaccharide deacetylase family protein [Aquimarina sp. 2201CG14-23]MDH7448050.1 polysaccharide deacetylase family protein [Aquimarina sp. 2201CG14-23]
MIWIKIKYRFALLYRTFLLKFGFQKLLLRNRYGERILVFHGIDTIGKTDYNSRFVSVDYFGAFIKYITTHFNVISLDDYYQKNFKPNTLNIALTFDDGYLNNYEHAVPILKKHNIPASFYITSIHSKNKFLWPDFIDLTSYYSNKKEINFEGNRYVKNSNNEFVFNGVSLKNKCKTISYDRITPLFNIFKDEWDIIKTKPLEEYWKLMTNDQIKEIANDPLFTIGSHGFTHANLIEIPNHEAETENLASKTILEEICTKSVDEFAFPFGTYNEQLVAHCKSLGFKKVLLVDYNNDVDKKDTTLRNRFVINPYISMKHQLVCLLKDSYF